MPGLQIQPGFSLLEIMVVMVIAGLMIALVPPLFSGAVSGTQLKGSARDLAIVLRETRSQAIIRNTEQLVHLDPWRQRVTGSVVENPRPCPRMCRWPCN